MNSALMIVRKNRYVRQVSTEDFNSSGEPGLQIAHPSANPEQNFVRRERTRILHGAIRKLRPRLRTVIEVAQFHDLPIKETAKMLDISVAAAKGRLHRAQAMLRKSLALRAIAWTRTESRYEFAPCVHATRLFCGVHSADRHAFLCCDGDGKCRRPSVSKK